LSKNHAIGSIAAAPDSAGSGAAPTPRGFSPVAAVTPTRHAHPLFQIAWHALNLLLVVSILAAMYCMAWEFSTRRYLKGFSDAIVPFTAAPEAKIEAILDWMAHGPARQAANSSIPATDRDPTDTLNYGSLLKVCGTATNAFINLADSSGLSARRLLLLDSNRVTVHVVAEVLIGDRWIIVDPAFRTLLRGPDGSLLTSHDLADPRIFAAATREIPGYDPTYVYSRTAHVRLSRINHLGLPLRKALNRLLPGWENSVTLSLLLERKSMAAMVIFILLVFMLGLVRIGMRWYAERRLGLRSVRIRAQVRRAVLAFLDMAN
jgi:hypothetical protein